MKKLLILLIIPFLNACIFTEIGNRTPPGDVIEEEFNVDFFDEADIGSAFNAVIIPSTNFRVTATGAERDVNDLNVRVINNTLKVSYVKSSWFGSISRDRVDLLIEVPELTAIDVSGAARVDIEDFTSFDLFRADLSGASKVNLDVEVSDLRIEISGASTLDVNRQTPNITASISGASKLNAFDADSEEVYLDLSGASKANVSVSDYLNVEASGASTVNYRGTPRIDQEVSGGSKVRKD